MPRLRSVLIITLPPKRRSLLRRHPQLYGAAVGAGPDLQRNHHFAELRPFAEDQLAASAGAAGAELFDAKEFQAARATEELPAGALGAAAGERFLDRHSRPLFKDLAIKQLARPKISI